MNFSPDNTQTLESLLAALGNGLSASTAYPILQQTIADQQAAVEARKERTMGWAQQVAEMASAGAPLGQVKGLMDILTPREGIPGSLRGLLQQAYPKPEFQGSFLGTSMPESYTQEFANSLMPRGEQLSPMYMNNPQAQMEAAMQQAEYVQALTPPAPEPASATSTAELDALNTAIQTLLAQGVNIIDIHKSLLSSPLTTPSGLKISEVYAANFSKISAIYPQLRTAAVTVGNEQAGG